MFNNNLVSRIGPLLVKNPPEQIIKNYYFDVEDFFTGEINKIKLYKEYDDNSILIPRYSKFYKDKVDIKNDLSSGDNIEITCYATPRNKIQEEATNFIVQHNDCIINLSPRRGKTVIAIMAICQVKKKTLILVDQTNLLDQWVSRIVEFTNYTENDIGVFRGDKQEFDKPIVLGMVQTIKNHVELNIKEIRTKFKSFGMVIVDEIHTIVGTEKLSLPLYSISSQRPNERCFG